MRHRTRRGVIDYRLTLPGKAPSRWGFEEFTLTRHGDGARVLRARCELHDEPPLIRDVIQTVDADFHPQDVYVRLTIADRFHGSSWYRFTDTQAELEGFTVEQGRISDKRPVSRAMRGFGTHALMADAWLSARFDFRRGVGIQTFTNNLLTSLDHRGATGPAFAVTTSALRYHGAEDVTVPAGTYACHHFAFENTSNDHPPYDMWVTTDGDFVFVKGVVAEPYNWSFELIRDRTDPEDYEADV